LREPKFTADDEYIFETLALNAGIILRNSMQYDQSIVFQQKLRSLINIGIRLSTKQNEMELLRATEIMVGEAFGDVAYMFLVDKERELIVRYNDQMERVEFPMQAGLVGMAITKKELLSLPDAYNHPSYNGKVDIATSMPVLVKPIMLKEGRPELRMAGLKGNFTKL